MKRKIAAIMAADVAGYSRLVAADEEGALAQLLALRDVFSAVAARTDGRIFNIAGDAILAEFPSAVEAVRAAIEIQEQVCRHNADLPSDRRMLFRIGLTIGDVMEREGDLLGDGVNIAARLQTLAPAGGICLSRMMHEQVAGKVREPFRDYGLHHVKNIPQPVHAFVLDPPSMVEPAMTVASGKALHAEPQIGELRAEPRQGRVASPGQALRSNRGLVLGASLGVLALLAAGLAFQLGLVSLPRPALPVLADLVAPPTPTTPPAQVPAPAKPAVTPAVSPGPGAVRDPALRASLPAAPPVARNGQAAPAPQPMPAPSAPAAAPVVAPPVPAPPMAQTAPEPAARPVPTSDAEPPAMSILPPGAPAARADAPVSAAAPPLSVPAAPGLLPPARVPASGAVPLRAETVPFICDECRRRIGGEFARGRGYKALAVEPLGAAGWATGEPSPEAARDKAMAQCRQQSRGRDCTLYATQDGVVWTHDEPPLPPSPWIPQAGVEPFDAERLVQLAPQARERVARLFTVPQATRVLALGPRGEWAAITDSLNVSEAARRALEACGHFAGAPCRVVAVDQSFVDLP